MPDTNTAPRVLPSLSFSPLTVEQFPLAKRFYKACRYPNSPGRLEKVCTLKNSNGHIVAAIRFLPEEPQANHWFLRSLCIAPSMRRQGIASVLLEKSLKYLNPEHCACFPFDYLETLYQGVGFHREPIENANKLRQTQWLSYQNQGKTLLYMVLKQSDA